VNALFLFLGKSKVKNLQGTVLNQYEKRG
jgi:hypothetical protein